MPVSLGFLMNVDRSAPAKSRGVRVIIAISLANLCFLRIWELLFHREDRDYVSAVPYSAAVYFSAVLGTCVLAAVFYGVVRCLQFSPHRGWRVGAMAILLLALIFPGDYLRRSVELSWIASSTFGHIAVVGAVALTCALALHLRQRFFAGLLWFAGVMSPYAVFNFGRAAVEIFDRGSHRVKAAPATEMPQAEITPAARRVVWIIFDEWDYNALFVHRPPDLRLPALDALLRRSVSATQAYAVANSTRVSIPSLLTGRVVAEALARGDDELLLRLKPKDEWVNFKDSDNIVKDALGLGGSVIAYGWYHPYSRILPQSPRVQARSFGFPAYDGIRGENAVSGVFSQLNYLANPAAGRKLSQGIYEEMQKAALAAVAASDVGFVFLHYGIPHSPGIFDRTAGRFSTSPRGNDEEYFGNLALVDRALADLIGAVRKAGLEDKTALILTSDHWWRTAPWSLSGKGAPVPLIICVGGSGQEIKWEKPLLTTCLRAVAEGILSGRLRDNAAVARELSEHAFDGPATYIDGRLTQ